MEEDLKNKVEALLFASGKFMSDENLSLILGEEVKSVKKVLKELKKDYDERDHSLMLTPEGNTWKINVREKYLDIVRKIVADTELPKSVLQTLAVIAWKSPVLQSEIVKIRSNKSYEHIAQLEEMGFVVKEPEGRSYILKVTEKFFEYFDVEGDKSLKEVFKDVKMPEKGPEQKTLNEKEDVLQEEAEIGEVKEGEALTEKEAEVLKETRDEVTEEELEEKAEEDIDEEIAEKPKVEVYDGKKDSEKEKEK